MEVSTYSLLLGLLLGLTLHESTHILTALLLRVGLRLHFTEHYFVRRRVMALTLELRTHRATAAVLVALAPQLLTPLLILYYLTTGNLTALVTAITNLLGLPQDLVVALRYWLGRCREAQ